MKNIIYPLFTSQSIVSDAISDTIDLRFNYGYAIVATFTGTPNGALRTQGSMDEVTWVDIDNTAQTDTTTRSYNKDAIYYPYIRLFWDNTSSGAPSTITAQISVKG